jgi:Copper type II ascorbate-dependent monooxygenase, C-terminal domain
MRLCFGFAVIAMSALVSCGGSSGGGDDDGIQIDANDQPVNGFRIVSPDIVLAPGEESTYCYYFRTPNTVPMAIHKWKSSMTPGSHHMIMFTTSSDAGTPGTTSPSCDGFGTQGGGTIWTYAAQSAEAEVLLPGDDGTGKPLAQDIPANTAAFFQMHYLNATDQPLTVHVQLDAEALESSVAYTKTAAFITYQPTINLPPMSQNVPVAATCNVPGGAKFWLLSTHAHKQAVRTEIKDGSAMVFESTDWEHPGEATFMEPSSFFSFASNKLTYTCTYTNPTNTTIVQGQSAERNEMCMATGYFFPATRPLFCLGNQGPF